MKQILMLFFSVLVLFSTSVCMAGERMLPDFFPKVFDDIFILDNDGSNKEGDTPLQFGEEKKVPLLSDTKEVKSIDLVIILDKSGSMYDMTDDTIGGFNSCLDEQRKKDIPVKVSVGMFNQVLDAKYDRVDLSEIKNITKEDYVPQGTTALFDAVGNTLSALKERPEVNAKGNKVLVVIMTDGMENASKEWSRDSVKKLITELHEKGYEFVFLGADIDAVGVAQGIGIKEENSVKFKKTGAGVKGNFKAINVMMEAVSVGNSLADDVKWRQNIVEDK